MKTKFTRILHATDFSEPSDHAFRLACTLAADYGAGLIVAHVRPQLPVAGGVMSYAPDPLEDHHALSEKLHALRPDDPAIAVRHLMAVGDAAAEIVALAGDEKCDLIVLGTQGRTGIGRLLMGSVAAAVVRTAACPVLTVRPAAG